MSEQLTYSAFESRYQQKTLIGSGGFAKVYKVFDHAKNHYVALKVADVRPEHKKFTLKNEVELVNKLQPHRNIARYDACYRFNTGFTGEMDFALLKFYEYGNLEQFLEREQLDLDDKKLIIQGILNGIEFLHQNNIIHRDMKAQNVLMNREDGVWTPKITDFGLSRQIMQEAAVENTAIGMSYAYAAPEQILNKKITKNVDLWAVGVIIYRIMANELPFKSKPQGDDRSTQSQLEISKRIVNMELPEMLNSISEPYQKIIRRCLVLDPSERVQSARELVDILLGHDAYFPELNIEVNANTGLVNPSLEEANEAAESTQLIDRPEPDSDSTQILETNAEPVKPPQSPPDPKAYAPPAPNYDLPRENLTQFIRPDENDEAPAETPDNGSGLNMGDPKKGFPWLWVAIPVLALGIGAVLWFTVLAPTDAPSTRRNASAEQTVPAGEGASASANKQIAFDELDAAIEAAGKNAEAQGQLTVTVEAMVSNDAYISDFQPLFLLSKHQAYLELAKDDPLQENYRKASDALKKAAEKAIIHQAKPDLLAAIQRAENGAFLHLKQAGGGGYFQNIVTSLQP